MQDANLNGHIRNIVITALMAAVVFVATYTIKINTFNGYVHLGDSMVLVAAMLLGKKKGAAASAIGMTIADLLYSPIWAVATFIIKGLMAYIAASIALRKGCEGNVLWNNLVAFIAAGLWMIIAYFVAGAFIISLITGAEASLGAGFIASAKDIPGNIGQAVAGIIIALPLSATLRKALKLEGVR
ncbi:ECF transporter S component [Clostridium thermarum]|uniref:ECF transporter S component n=1 Tax=Clostridium thermarum TaxID=1716543 RepID=UPI001123E2BB|nr:ECF transporter S component [Clostridium thermarum]